MSTARSSRELLARLMDGYLNTQLLHVAASLGLADLLAGGPRSSAYLAAAAGADPAVLHRLLRGLAAEGVLDEDEDGRFVLTEAGMALRSDVPGSLHGAILTRGELYYAAAAGLLTSVRHGGSAFRHAYGLELFEHLSRHARHADAFQRSMRARAYGEADALIRAYDFTPIRHIVDIGGGQGVTLTAILTAYPQASGTLFDRPEVAEMARDALAATNVAARTHVVGGDFFEEVPGGGDLYLLMRVIHDWDDPKAVRILATCRAAMRPHARLVLVEAVLGARAQDQPAAIRMDLHMLTLAGGKERTASEFEQILRAAGFDLRRIITPHGVLGISLIEAVPAALD